MQIVVPILILLAIVLFYAYKRKKEREMIEQVTPITRGEPSERKLVLSLLRMGIHPKAIFHDLYLQKPNGEYTQIDLVVATKVGIIVIEVKDYSGWIFGNDRQRYWTQVLAYGRERHRFYNPILQNAGHVETLHYALPQNRQVPIYSFVVFYGNCRLRNVINNRTDTYVMYAEHVALRVQEILSKEAASYGNKYEVMQVLTQGVENGKNPEIVSAQRSTARSAASYNRRFFG